MQAFSCTIPLHGPAGVLLAKIESSDKVNAFKNETHGRFAFAFSQNILVCGIESIQKEPREEFSAEGS